ncbi:MAG: replication-associated recombination protein A [Neisseriales bacterium]|nr:MAG: replication-associated recombination protein A [Neisseriales bacterium]
MLDKPLADLLRPTTLEEVVGQDHLVGLNRPLRLAVESDAMHSMILWGPPGVGKTTLARILANSFHAKFVSISAVLSGVKEIRDVILHAKTLIEQSSQRTILFVDEVHRFNKSQQDAFLPYVETGLLTFIGATTENPSFEVNNALLSRVQVYQLASLMPEALRHLFQRIECDPLFKEIKFEDAVIEVITRHADGDARRFLNAIEQLLKIALSRNLKIVHEGLFKEVMSDTVHLFDKQGDVFYEQISALHKSVRGSHPDAALYWFCRMLDGGADPHYLARRIIRMAWEDIGLADPRATDIALNAAHTYERLGSPEGELALAEAVIYLSIAAKSNASYIAYNEARAFVKHNGSPPVPLHLRNATTDLMKKMHYGAEYCYAHDEPNAYVVGEQYWPDGMANQQWYKPTERGLEVKIAQKMRFLQSLNQAADDKK